MKLEVITPPSTASITADIVKANKRILHSQEDDLIDFWIRAADDYIAKAANISMMEQTLELKLDAVLPCVDLPRGPVSSIESVKYVDKDGVEVVLTSGDWDVGTRSGMAFVRFPAFDQSRVSKGSMTIRYVAGATTPDGVSFGLRQASLLLTSHWFVSREAAFLDKRIMDVVKTIPFGVEAAIKLHRVPNSPDELNGGY